MIKIISYSLWGDNRIYLDGAIKNAELQDSFYKDWIRIFYVDDTVPSTTIDTLLSLKVHIINCDKSDGYDGLYWRMRPLYMFPDSIVIVRDCDSIPTVREESAVTEWVNSEYPFHIMRDHKFHKVPILGGLFGAYTSFMINLGFEHILRLWLNSLEPGNNPRGKYFNSDQLFLKEKIWPIVKSFHLAHDEHFNFSGNEKPFPSPLIEDHFVGSRYHEWGTGLIS